MEIQKFQNLQKWSEAQWGNSSFNDKRRNKRAVKLGVSLMTNPEKSLPQQTQSWKDLKAAYRLLNEKDITYEKLEECHWKNVIDEVQNESVVLFIQDTSEIDYTFHNSITGLGPIGDSRGKGFFLHSCLAVIPREKNSEIIGLAMQHIWTRRPEIYKGKETKIERRKRKTEADIWKETLSKITPSNGSMWVSIGDRGNDIFDFFTFCNENNWHYVTRVCHDRKIKIQGTELSYLKQHIQKSTPKATKFVEIRGRNGCPKRKIKLNVSWDQVTILPPRLDKGKNLKSINGCVIRCWEDKLEGLEWILFTDLPVEDEQSVLTKIDWYSKRWLIEEYHKCLKTGCKLEKRQLETLHGLKAITGFLAIIAIRLLQIRYISRLSTSHLAKDLVDSNLLQILCKHFNCSVDTLSVKSFWINLARLGGFIGRRGDGYPGWQTLWEGWKCLQYINYGLELGKNVGNDKA